MVGTQRLLAIAMAFLLASTPISATPEVLGIVVVSNRASLGTHSASEGTSVYDGDRLPTETGGALRLRSGRSMIFLAEESCVVIHRKSSGAAGGFDAELVSGQVVLSVAAGSGSEIIARGTFVEADSNGAMIVEVRVLGPKELSIFARRGSVRFSYRNETEIIPEGKAVRVVLDPRYDGASTDQSTKRSWRHGKAFIVIAVAAAVATAITVPLMLRQSYESPDRP